MGYYTHYEGALKVTPALPDSFAERWNTSEPELAGRWSAPNNGRGQWWRIRQGEHFPDGSLRIETFIEGPGDEAKFYHFDDWIRLIVAEIREDYPDHKISGEILWDGEEREDVGRIIVTDGVADVKKAQLVYL